jgi:hypothetical protein
MALKQRDVEQADKKARKSKKPDADWKSKYLTREDMERVLAGKTKPPTGPALEDRYRVSLSGGGLQGIENAIYLLADNLGNIATNGYEGENKLAIFTGPSGEGFHPILIALEPSDTTDKLIAVSERVATAFERIADALAALHAMT